MNKILTIETKLFLKIFLVITLFLLILTTIIDNLIGVKIELLTLIIQSAIVGFLMSWFISSQTLNRLKSNGISEIDENTIKVNQIEVIQKSITIAQLSMLLKQDDKTKNWKQNINDATIKISTKMSFHSWGENILISNLENQIKIESKPKFILTIFDMGINFTNINTIKKIIELSNN